MISSAIDFVSGTFGLVTPVDWVMFVSIGLLVNFVTAFVMHRLLHTCVDMQCIEKYVGMDDGIRYTVQEDCRLVWQSEVSFYIKLLLFTFWPWSIFVRWIYGKWIIVPYSVSTENCTEWRYATIMAILMPVKILFNLVSYPIIVVAWFIYITIMIAR